MGPLRAILAEIAHLFVDDGSLALALVTWCAVVGALGLVLPALLTVLGPAYFLGCAAILLGNAVRAGGRRDAAPQPRPLRGARRRRE
jgi:hypothetical protein